MFAGALGDLGKPSRPLIFRFFFEERRVEGAYGGRIPFGVALTNAICPFYNPNPACMAWRLETADRGVAVACYLKGNEL